MREKYESEKARSKSIQDAKIKLDSLKVKRDEAERSGDTQTAADLEYYAIPETKTLIERLEIDRAQADAESPFLRMRSALIKSTRLSHAGQAFL